MKNVYATRMINSIIIILAGNLPLLLKWFPHGWISVLILIGFVIVNLKPVPAKAMAPKRSLRLCQSGCELLRIFLISMSGAIVFMLLVIPLFFKEDRLTWFLNIGTVFLAEAVVFWNGIIRVYCSSVQIGIKWRAVGILCGWIPVANLIVLTKIIHLASEEVKFEGYKIQSNEYREYQRLCATKYPILLVHGVFFRDFKYLNYWGRIPGELEKNGAQIYYGNHQSAAAISDSAAELKERIMEILAETGAQKVNVIAHSKGGLDIRYAVSKLGMGQYIASVTTINTPHRGCEFADYLLSKIPESVKNKIADGYNAALKKMGDFNPDFLVAVNDLRASACKSFNEQVSDDSGVYYQSVGSKLNAAMNGKFPLNFSYQLVKYFDGANDGLVSESSFPWGSSYQFLTIPGKRGISHGDMIDLNRENIPGFDVREFYVNLVHQLKEKGF